MIDNITPSIPSVTAFNSTLSRVATERLEELLREVPDAVKPVIQRRLKQREVARKHFGLIPDEAYGPVTELTDDQKERLHNLPCPVRKHNHTVAVLHTIADPENGQLVSRLACHQGGTRRWELVHGTVITMEAAPHWGFSKKDDAPFEGWAIYTTTDYL